MEFIGGFYESRSVEGAQLGTGSVHDNLLEKAKPTSVHGRLHSRNFLALKKR